MLASASHGSGLVPAKRAQGPTSITTRPPVLPTQFAFPSEGRSPEFWTPASGISVLLVGSSSQGRMGLALGERRNNLNGGGWGERGRQASYNCQFNSELAGVFYRNLMLLEEEGNGGLSSLTLGSHQPL